MLFQPRDSAYYDLLGGVLSWLCSAHLSQPLTTSQQAAVQHTGCRILPSVAALLPQVPSLGVAGLQLPVLQFVYWCVTHVNTQKQVCTCAGCSVCSVCWLQSQILSGMHITCTVNCGKLLCIFYPQKSTIASTLRRIGEDVYKPVVWRLDYVSLNCEVHSINPRFQAFAYHVGRSKI